MNTLDIFDRIVGYMDSMFFWIDSQDYCPECDSRTDRKIKRNSEGWTTVARFSCSNCGWNRE